MSTKADRTRGGDVAAVAIDTDVKPQDGIDESSAQYRLFKKLRSQTYVAYDALDADERNVADVLMSSGAVRTIENQDGFLYLAKPSGIISWLRGDNGKFSILHRLAAGRVFTGP